MEIIVWDRNTAIKEVKNLTTPAAVISISTVGDDFPIFNEPEGIKILYLAFDDVEDCDKYHTPISTLQALDIRNFVEDNKDTKTLVVHCDAGVSRSAAVAAAIGKYLYNDDMFIFGRPRFCPNRTVYRKVLQAFYERELLEEEKEELNEKENWNIEIWRHFFFTLDNEEDIKKIDIIPMNETLDKNV
jgi:protein-tyrosine phosphatase